MRIVRQSGQDFADPARPDGLPSGPPVEADLLGRFPLDRRTVPQMLDDQAGRHADRLLLRAGDTSWTYADARGQAALHAGRLASAGIAAGDRVAILCGNRAEFMGLFLGCAWLGAVSVPINVASRGFQLQHILRDSGARLIAIESELAGALDTVDLAATSLSGIWHIGAPPDGDRQGVPSVPVPAGGEPAAAAVLGPGDLLTILYTSGTTGLSKGVCCPHGQYALWAYYVGRQLGLRDGDVLHTTLPLFHTNALGCFFQALLHGATQVVGRRFSVTSFWPDLVASGATVTYLLGAMVPMLLSRPPRPEEREHGVRISLAPGVPAHFQDEFLRRSGIGIIDGYGATESNAVIGSDMSSRRVGWMGTVQEGFLARVVDEHDAAVPDGTAGELVLRAAEPCAFASGYFGMPDRTVEAWRNLWLHTGDRVVRSHDGYYRFVDRMKDAIRRRGENISSFEVEQVLQAHPAVENAAVFAVGSPLGEDEVMTAILLKAGTAVSAEDLVRFCEGKMSYFCVPRYVEFVDEMPRTENGKVKKFELRQRGLSASTWDREAAGVVVRRT